MKASGPPTPDDALTWLVRDVPTQRDILGLDDPDDVDQTAPPSMRRQWIRQVGFAIPCREAIDAIGTAPLLEIGAGTGYWSALLTRAGGDVVATDAWTESRYGQTVGRYHPVKHKAAVEAVLAHADRDVLCIWPERNREWCANALEVMAPGRTLHMIGEPRGGCTGDDNLFDVIVESFRCVRTVRIPTWPGLHDHLVTYLKEKP